ncbi:MAG: M14 family metallopeptidase [Candidatus Bathyarchaeia archaeon]
MVRKAILIFFVSVLVLLSVHEIPALLSVDFVLSSDSKNLSVDWSHYHNYTEIVEILLRLNVTYPNVVDVFSIGKSWQNRTIYCVRLTNENVGDSKPKVLFVGYHHARERIAAELPLYFVVYAAENYGVNSTVTQMLDMTEIYVVVALNVDGFDAVETNEWQRKNLHPFDEDNDGLFEEDPPDDEDGDGFIEDLVQWNGTDWIFIRWEGIDDDGDGLLNEDWVGGVDLNRNYGFQWNATCESGSSEPKAEDFRGAAPFSEPETQAIRDLALQHDFKYAVSFHSGSENIVYPWGYTTASPPHNETFVEIAQELSQLIECEYEQSGTWFTTSGVWDDWMYNNRSTLAFTCEIYANNSAFQYEPSTIQNFSWERGVFQFFNPDPKEIETTLLRWMPVFFCITNVAIEQGPTTFLGLYWWIWALITVALIAVGIAAVFIYRGKKVPSSPNYPQDQQSSQTTM